jgi:hypothetical protein
MEEASAAWSINQHDFELLVSSNGTATAQSLSSFLGNVGSVIFGQGLHNARVPAREVVGLLIALFDHDRDGAVTLQELSPMQMPLDLFQTVRTGCMCVCVCVCVCGSEVCVCCLCVCGSEVCVCVVCVCAGQRARIFVCEWVAGCARAHVRVCACLSACL